MHLRTVSETIFGTSSKGGAMSDDVLPLLKVHEYFRGMSDDILQEIVRHSRVTHHATGDVVHEANALLRTVGFVLRGRLKAVRVDSRGNESLFRMIGRGEQFGMMVGAVSEPVPIRVVALEPTVILGLDFEKAMDLTFHYPDLRRLWLTTFAGSLKKHFFGAAPRRAPMMLALAHESPASRRAAERLIDRLRDANRIIFDVRTGLERELASRWMEVADRVVYFVPGSSADTAVGRLRALDVSARGWRDKISIAWLLDRGEPVAPVVPELGDLVCRDFKIVESAPGLPHGLSLAGGLERLVHDLRGVRIGVALGGGAARGLSHLGVLKALERSGVVVDMVAGTSAGAMTGILYASGHDCDYLSAQFENDLRPSWIFRHLPNGNQWYLLYKYRRGQFEPMLRKYLRDWRLEQLAVPCLSVTVDLVGGNSVVRERGDAVGAILQSINLPVLSVPICDSGQALVDGGLVNNIPADVLVSKGCNFVIAISVTAKMEKQFCDITPERSTPIRARPGILQTLLRSLLVQNHSLNAIGVQPADVVIEPDVTRFDLAEFMRAKELAAIGEAAALEQIPKIRQLLTRLDPQLFQPVS
jgi:predicted acylesterase/phospholipase RssA/CRP-like cAMP-binding protein